jgi:hypothetical protein
MLTMGRRIDVPGAARQLADKYTRERSTRPDGGITGFLAPSKCIWFTVVNDRSTRTRIDLIIESRASQLFEQHILALSIIPDEFPGGFYFLFS